MWIDLPSRGTYLLVHTSLRPSLSSVPALLLGFGLALTLERGQFLAPLKQVPALGLSDPCPRLPSFFPPLSLSDDGTGNKKKKDHQGKTWGSILLHNQWPVLCP